MSNLQGSINTKINLNGELFKMGTKGYSAYEVAVQQGFKGTVDEWLASLVGPQGPQGIEGPQGPAGTPGKSATIQIGSVTTLDAGSEATVTNVGTENEAIFNFGIPKGEPGSGGGGTTDYINLSNKPKINNVELNGNKTLDELGIQPKGTYLTSVPSVYKTKAENDALYQPIGDYATTSDIPTKTSQLTNDSGYIKGYTETDPTVPTHVKNISTTDISNWNNKSNFSGSYDDLSNKPTIPTVPTNVSSFTNDAGYLTSVPSEYVTETELNDVISGLGGGTGNVSSTTINSIEVVDNLPTTEVEGVLYLVKESGSSGEETNLYNPSTAPVLNCSINNSTFVIQTSTSGTSRTTYLEIEPNTTYKIEKIAGSNFIVGTCSIEPADGVALNTHVIDNNASEITITSSSSDNYLAIYYCKTSEDTLTEEELRSSIVVTKVESTNLWVNPTVLTGNYIDSSNGYIGTQSVAYTAYIPCETSTTYKITRTMSGYRFIIGSYSSVPKDGSTTSNFTVANSLSELTFTTGSTDTYLAIYYFGGSETLDATELLNDIVVTKAETNNLFSTSEILYSSSGSEYSSPVVRGGITYTYDTNSEVVNLNGTTNNGLTQGFKQTITLESGKTYKFYATIESGSISLGSKTYGLLLEIKSIYNGSKLSECYVSSTDTTSYPEEVQYTPSSNLTEWYVMISQRSSEVSFTNCNLSIHVEEV